MRDRKQDRHEEYKSLVRDALKLGESLPTSRWIPTHCSKDFISRLKFYRLRDRRIGMRERVLYAIQSGLAGGAEQRRILDELLAEETL